MDNMELRYNWDYLLELGYTSEELEEYEEDYADDILELLTDENLVAIYQNNVRYLLNYLEKDEVFPLITWNTSAIMLSSQTFVSRMERIAGVLGENWAQLIYELYWESEEPLWDAVGYLCDSDWEDAFIRGTAEIEDTFL